MSNISSISLDTSISYNNGSGWLTATLTNNDSTSKKINVSVTSGSSERSAKLYLKINNKKTSNYITILQKENNESVMFYFYTNYIENDFSFVSNNIIGEKTDETSKINLSVIHNTWSELINTYPTTKERCHVFFNPGKTKCSVSFYKTTSGYKCKNFMQYDNPVNGNFYIFDDTGNNLSSDTILYSDIKQFFNKVNSTYNVYYLCGEYDNIIISNTNHILCNFASVTNEDVLSGKYDGSTDDKIYNK